MRQHDAVTTTDSRIDPARMSRAVALAIELLPQRSRALLVIAANKLHNTRGHGRRPRDRGACRLGPLHDRSVRLRLAHEQMVAGLRQRLPESRSVGLLDQELARL
jgi:hypothetical protein